MATGSGKALTDEEVVLLELFQEPGLFAELDGMAEARQLQFQTLKDLKLPNPEAALAQGFVCVRPGKTVDYCRRPGLWVAPYAVPLLRQVLQAAAQAHYARQGSKVAQAEALRAQLQAQVQAVLGTAGWGMLSADDQAAIQTEIDKLPAWPQLVMRLVERAYQATPDLWEGCLQKKPRGWRIFFSTRFHGHTVRARGYCEAIDLLRPVLLKEPSALNEALLSNWPAIVARAEDLWQHWAPTRPHWFSAAALAEWVVQAAEAPPLAEVYDPYTNPLYYQVPQEMRNACRKGKRFNLELLVTGGGQPTPVRLAVPLSEQLDAAWQVPAETLEYALLGAHGHLQQEKLAALHQGVETALAEQDPAPLGWTGEQWRAHGWAAVLSVAANGVWQEPELLARVPEVLRDTASTQKAHFLAQRCQTQLPAQLKDCYPLARSLGRRLTLIIGDTNSGKTHRALTALQAAAHGVYLAPLRLLAQETRDRLHAAGVPTSLVTGEWLDVVPEARHIAATVEMADLTTTVDVGVLDEVHLLADPERGPAWLRALLGLPAKELFLIGPPEVKGAVTQLAQYLGEPLEVVEVQRLAPLQLKATPTPLADLKAGSAVIAFSRQEVLGIAAILRATYGRQPAVLYGALSPEVRREQARLFNTGEADVLVATDVIGMGLNLPIQELIFASTEKWDGRAWVSLTPEQARQIAGRAGRYGRAEKGEVGALDETVLKEVHRLLTAPRVAVQPEYLYSLDWPTLALVADQLKTQSLEAVFEFFEKQPLFEARSGLRPVITETQKRLAACFDEHSNFSLSEKFVLCFAPVSWLGDCRWSGDFQQCMQALAQGTPMRIGQTARLQASRYQKSLMETEALLQRLTLYSWLHYRFPEIFPDVAEAQHQMKLANKALGQLLAQAEPRRCTACGKRLSWRHPHAQCDACHRTMRWRLG